MSKDVDIVINGVDIVIKGEDIVIKGHIVSKGEI